MGTLGAAGPAKRSMRDDVARHFRDQIRSARAIALKDAEAFEEVVFVIERIGVYLTGKVGNLGVYAEPVAEEAAKSPLAVKVPEQLPQWHTPFTTLYDLVRQARNDALHQGAFARHLTAHVVELTLILEDALMIDAVLARDFMVKDPVCAFFWEPISSVRRSMLANSFSCLPVAAMPPITSTWTLVQDVSIATYLRSAKSAEDRKHRLASSLCEAVEAGQIALTDAPVCKPDDHVSDVLKSSQGRPVLVVGQAGDLRGIVTPFDLL